MFVANRLAFGLFPVRGKTHSVTSVSIASCYDTLIIQFIHRRESQTESIVCAKIKSAVKRKPDGLAARYIEVPGALTAVSVCSARRPTEMTSLIFSSWLFGKLVKHGTNAQLMGLLIGGFADSRSTTTSFYSWFNYNFHSTNHPISEMLSILLMASCWFFR